ncbi:methyltransferase domain-containing protein [Acidiferrimicrobium sp. IK]|uniref:methyltransferase domain-containing protein n=1 Tax=Acidiferrimicrobium sp. IK TaxID=2871700 RepID=UPI0021CB8001|nr:methyltransferase domain-containing protein [Acidiferrimicrobium sp. IK]MCU4185574.1 methyltransferase domain-containing protein [Acidiferrimicrobium sp. IK]
MLRSTLRRSSTARAVYHQVSDLKLRATDRVLSNVTFASVPAPVAVRLLYEILLGRQPDASGFEDNLGQLVSGAMTRDELSDFVRGSEEFQNRGWTARTLGPSIHAGRCQFIRSLPPARRIVDLGGTHLAREDGAMVALGYPYAFDELTIVDLPSNERHEIYRSTDGRHTVETPLGPVRYRYHSMTDLSGFAADSIDLVYSGQSIEHVSPDDGASVLAQVHRILRPGGHLAIDTPNGRVTRMQQAEFVDPDHKVEYTWPELEKKLISAGFEIESAAGLGWAGPPAQEGRFDPDQVAKHAGMHGAVEDCYILAVVARKSPAVSAG